MTYDDLLTLCKQRHSVRTFDETELLTIDDVTPLLELARLAPSVENAQPWHFYLIFDVGLRAKLMETSCYGNFILGAAVFIVVTCNKASHPQSTHTVWNPRELEFSCVAAMEHIMLGATAKGLASSWVSLHHGPAHEVLGLTNKDEVVIGGLMLGHPKPSEPKEAEHKRNPLSDIYTIR